MAKDGDIRIDLRGDGRIILYKRLGLKDPVWLFPISTNGTDWCCQSNRNSSPIGGAVALSARA
jgi:hypothetical protein